MRDFARKSCSLWGLLRCTQGSGLLETALALPVFFLLVFGFISFSLVGLDMLNATCGAHDAARYIALHGANTYGYVSDAVTQANAQSIIDKIVIPYPTRSRNLTYFYCGDLTNSPGYHYQCVKVIMNITYTITLPGYTYNGLKFFTFTEGIYVAPQ